MGNIGPDAAVHQRGEVVHGPHQRARMRAHVPRQMPRGAVVAQVVVRQRQRVLGPQAGHRVAVLVGQCAHGLGVVAPGGVVARRQRDHADAGQCLLLRPRLRPRLRQRGGVAQRALVGVLGTGGHAARVIDQRAQRHAQPCGQRGVERRRALVGQRQRARRVAAEFVESGEEVAQRQRGDDQRGAQGGVAVRGERPADGGAHVVDGVAVARGPFGLRQRRLVGPGGAQRIAPVQRVTGLQVA
ncbi:hypothetical protein D3C87_1160550 [compost metagenome]